MISGIGTRVTHRLTYWLRGRPKPMRCDCALWHIELRKLQQITGGGVVAYEVRRRRTLREVARGYALNEPEAGDGRQEPHSHGLAAVVSPPLCLSGRGSR